MFLGWSVWFSYPAVIPAAMAEILLLTKSRGSMGEASVTVKEEKGQGGVRRSARKGYSLIEGP
jgi:hypothetical protein